MVERLSVTDLCDVVYALWVDRAANLDDLDAWLASKPISSEQMELRTALGLRGSGG